LQVEARKSDAFHHEIKRLGVFQGELCQRDQVRDALSRDLEAAQYATDRTFRQYDASDPENRLVTAELEARWNRMLQRKRCVNPVGLLA